MEDRNSDSIDMLRMSYPPVIGKIDFEADVDQEVDEKPRIGKHFFNRAKSSKQFEKADFQLVYDDSDSTSQKKL